MTGIQTLINQEVQRLLEKHAQNSVPSEPTDLTKLSSGLKHIHELTNQEFQIEKMADATRGIVGIAIESVEKVASEVLDLKAKNEILEKAAEVREIIDSMLEKGVLGQDAAHEKIAELMDKTTYDLQVVKEATKMAIGFNHEKIGSLEGGDVKALKADRTNPMNDVIENDM